MVLKKDYLNYIRLYKGKNCPPANASMKKQELAVIAIKLGFNPNHPARLPKSKKSKKIIKTNETKKTRKEIFKEIRVLGEKISKATSKKEAEKYKKKSDALIKLLKK